jgi:hypothetical protein
MLLSVAGARTPGAQMEVANVAGKVFNWGVTERRYV